MKKDCCCPPLKKAVCDCCEGTGILTPLSTVNRPGLTELRYRISTHATFLETMMARLSSSEERFSKLSELTTREGDDAAIAMLDAWTTVADVLTFYQERIANEGYLSTATERRSTLELGRLVGYKPRPGVASSVYLAYTLSDNPGHEVVIPKGALSKSVPGPGEKSQPFETSEDLKARAERSVLWPRMSRPQKDDSLPTGKIIYFAGLNTGLNLNDLILIENVGEDGPPEVRRVEDVLQNVATNCTLVTLESEGPRKPTSIGFGEITKKLVEEVSNAPQPQLASGKHLKKSLDAKFVKCLELPDDYESIGTGAGLAATKALSELVGDNLSEAISHAKLTSPKPIRVYALRMQASFFGSNHPGTAEYDGLKINGYIPPNISRMCGNFDGFKDSAWEQGISVLYLDSYYESVKENDWIVVECPAGQYEGTVFEEFIHVTRVSEARPFMASSWGVATKISQIRIADPLPIKDENDEAMEDAKKAFLQSTDSMQKLQIHVQGEELTLGKEPIETNIGSCPSELIEREPIELDGFCDGLESGRWVIVSGERVIDVEGEEESMEGVDEPGICATTTVAASELALLANTCHAINPKRYGDTPHTFIQLDRDLAYCYKRDTLKIYANVVKATHGETREELLGSGDGTKALQSFSLKQPPLTHVPASNPSGADSTLKLYVNDIEWKEADALAGLSGTDRKFITKTDDEGKTKIIFGNGVRGARLPTGVDNINAGYRNGIGKAGNVDPESITQLTDRPLGVKQVTNPLRASGGAGRETRDQIRRHAPLAVKALDRLVSVQDYEDFTRIFAGVGKARAVELTDGRRQLVHITIAGVDDSPIDINSDLYRNLLAALREYGEPYQAIKVAIRELKLMVISANVRIVHGYLWESIYTNVQAALLDAFSFERRELGQDVLLSEVVSVIQAVPGVAYSDIDCFGGLPERKLVEGNRELLTPDEIAERVRDMCTTGEEKNTPKLIPDSRIPVNLATTGSVQPAQLAFLSPDVVSHTLILNPIT